MKLKDIKIFATVLEGKYHPVNKPLDDGFDIQQWKLNAEKLQVAVQKYINENSETMQSYLDFINGNCCMCSSLSNIARALNGTN